ncbi:hypothetical protein PLANPX_2184 [Lacipirellula parvula]|uniref:Uncharacterized protein n=1 Tax=Lacipirellula parvula TaxID=2650471 RepID=A0A5K7X9P2_9BACT|nr:hypothetical protein PLANPX_2184 [Lacipirellula parvula]
MDGANEGAIALRPPAAAGGLDEINFSFFRSSLTTFTPTKVG